MGGPPAQPARGRHGSTIWHAPQTPELQRSGGQGQRSPQISNAYLKKHTLQLGIIGGTTGAASALLEAARQQSMRQGGRCVVPPRPSACSCTLQPSAALPLATLPLQGPRLGLLDSPVVKLSVLVLHEPLQHAGLPLRHHRVALPIPAGGGGHGVHTLP